MNDHSTIGLVITTDGSFGEIPRGNYLEAEEKTILALKRLRKPFLPCALGQLILGPELCVLILHVGQHHLLHEADVKVVHLDRPFLYMIIDCRERLPIFMGTVEAVTAPREIRPGHVKGVRHAHLPEHVAYVSAVFAAESGNGRTHLYADRIPQDLQQPRSCEGPGAAAHIHGNRGGRDRALIDDGIIISKPPTYTSNSIYRRFFYAK